jgi:hypothetical protein
MGMNPERETVVGVFESEAAAARALEGLLEAHFDIEADAGVVVSNDHDRQPIPIWSDVPVGRGAAIGAAIGAFLAALGVAIAGLDFGPFSLVAWGPAYAALEAAYAGAAVGVATGAMMSFEFAEPRAAFHLARIHDGTVWVGVKAVGERAERAERILTEAGGRHVPDHFPPVAAAA